MNGPYPKLLATPTSIATTHADGRFASTRAGIPGVRKKPFFTLYVNVFMSSLIEPDARLVRAAERAESRLARIDAGIRPLELEVPGRAPHRRCCQARRSARTRTSAGIRRPDSSPRR